MCPKGRDRESGEGHCFLRRVVCLSPLRASMPATPRERFTGTGFRCLAHAFTSSARQTGVARSRAIGSGKSSRRVHRFACVREVFSIAATSASPTRSSGFRAIGLRLCSRGSRRGRGGQALRLEAVLVVEPSPEKGINLPGEVIALLTHQPRCAAGVVQSADSRHASAPLTAFVRSRLHSRELPVRDCP